MTQDVFYHRFRYRFHRIALIAGDPKRFCGFFDRFFTDLGRYLRLLEEAIIRTCSEYGVAGTRVDGRTGVWVGPDDQGLERKICAMGVRCSRWVTMHGFAFNLNTDLDFFGHIVPCGITDRGVTSLAAEVGRPVDEAAVQQRVTAHLASLLDATPHVRTGADAHAALRDLAGPADALSAAFGS